jgi:hypothetical protein
MKTRDPVAVVVANIVKAAVGWAEVAIRDRAASRKPSVEQEECKARLFASVEAYKAARRAEKFEEERPTTRIKKS